MKTALVFDHGLYGYVASALVAGFDRVLYFSPYSADAFPVSRKSLWGSGLPGVTRVNDFFDHVAEADIIVFPDHGAGDLQVYLKEQGHAVWGSGAGEVLELNRVGFRQLQEKLGMPHPRTYMLKGLTALREHLEDPRNDNQYVKLGEFRGDLESHHHVNTFLSEPWLRDLEHRLGPMGDSLTFMSERAIDDAVEVGFDGLFLGGRFCSPCAWGLEVKDLAYVGRVCDYDELPTVLLESNAKLAPVLRQMDCRSFISTELRVTEDGNGFLIDPCLRIPSPPGGALLEAYSNWPEIFTLGAAGETPTPKPKAEFIAELVLRSDFAEDDFLAIEIPEKYRDLVKLHGHARVDGVDYIVAIGMDVVGSACGTGDTMEAATEQAIEVAKSLSAYQLTYDESGFTVARERIAKAKDFGIDWP